jgi:hypothetical protein
MPLDGEGQLDDEGAVVRELERWYSQLPQEAIGEPTRILVTFERFARGRAFTRN